MPDRYFLKLGGSLLTDKTGVESMRPGVLSRIAAEIRNVRQSRPSLQLLVGHGAGSFGHVVAAKHGTRLGVTTPEQWLGFAEVRASMMRINRLIIEALLDASVPAVTFQPSASAMCEDGRIVQIASEPVLAALEAGLVPVIHGDVAFDSVRGGTIISTEEVLMALAQQLRPRLFLLAGETPGVLDQQQQPIPRITRANYDQFAAALGGSHGTDVTGGMADKVLKMLALADNQKGLDIRIFSGTAAGALEQALRSPEDIVGTIITAR